jgi:NAD(P)-dependent dehydrogenase (short-subunit alcohol dehydrogenase family)
MLSRGWGLATPAGRSGSPAEAAAAIAWLASPGASRSANSLICRRPR